MKNIEEKTVGIIGGMGPEATSYFFDKIIHHTPATKDQDHLKILIINNPNIPDRSAAILEGGPSPVEDVQKEIKWLEKYGAEILAIPCVSMHYFINELLIPPKVIFLNILEETYKFTKNIDDKIKKIGILGTNLTIKKKLFDPFFIKNGCSVLEIDDEIQNQFVMKAIYGIKSGKIEEPLLLLKKAIKYLKNEGAEAIVSGCTEIPLIVNSDVTGLPFVDCLDCLAKSVVKHAMKH